MSNSAACHVYADSVSFLVPAPPFTHPPSKFYLIFFAWKSIRSWPFLNPPQAEAAPPLLLRGPEEEKEGALKLLPVSDRCLQRSKQSSRFFPPQQLTPAPPGGDPKVSPWHRGKLNPS